MVKNLSSKDGQNLFDSAKKSTAGARKAASKRAIQETAEGTGDWIGNKIEDKITNVSQKSSTRSQNNETKADRASPNDVPRKRCVSQEERQQIIDELRLV